MTDPHLAAALDAFAGLPSVLVATDFDGVLAPLVDDPAASRPVPGSVELLRELAALPGTHVAVVSGRHLDDLRAVSGLGTDDGITLVGSHGAEASVDLSTGTVLDDAARERLAACVEALTDVVGRHPPARLELKPAGAVLHTRGIDPGVAAAAAAEAGRIPVQVPGTHVMNGKDVVEIGVLDVSKGMALQALAAQLGSRATLYLGDDVTDERAFAVLPAADGHVTVKVGPGGTVAAHRVAGPDEVLAVLRAVAAARGRNG